MRQASEHFLYSWRTRVFSLLRKKLRHLLGDGTGALARSGPETAQTVAARMMPMGSMPGCS